jgi:micrococcal nuclease
MEVRMPDGGLDTIRLLGVDTPETSPAETRPGEWEAIPETSDGRDWLASWGNNATRYAEQRLGGREIYIETEANSDRRGSYDRLLVYAFQSESAETSFNSRLIENGYARMYDAQFSQRSRYETTESQAQTGVGVWNYEASSTGGPTVTSTPTGSSTATSTQTATGTPRGTATATPTMTTTPNATPSDGTSQQSYSLVVSDINADAPGNDHKNLNDEFIEFTNEGRDAIDMSGWTLSDEADHTYHFPSGFTLSERDTVTVYTGSGSNTEDELYWNSGRAVWNNAGDTIYVRDDSGETVIEREYAG